MITVVTSQTTISLLQNLTTHGSFVQININKLPKKKQKNIKSNKITYVYTDMRIFLTASNFNFIILE